MVAITCKKKKTLLFHPVCPVYALLGIDHLSLFCPSVYLEASQVALVVKNLPAGAGDRDTGSIPR